MPSFDIVSQIDEHELKNALDQLEREINQRYDFKGTQSEVISKPEHIYELVANSEDRVKAILDVLKEKLIKRKISLKFIDAKLPVAKGGQMHSITVNIKKGIDKEHAKNIVQLIKDNKSLKVVPSIQGESVRVTGKKKDDLQEVMQVLKTKDLEIELTFNNFRD